jgi:hypothetical protein
VQPSETLNEIREGKVRYGKHKISTKANPNSSTTYVVIISPPSPQTKHIISVVMDVLEAIYTMDGSREEIGA